MQNRTVKVIRNTIILSVILIILFIVTGVMPYFLGLAAAVLTGNMEVLISYGFAVPGVLVSFFAGILGLLIGLLPIWLPVGIVYWIVKRNKQLSREQE